MPARHILQHARYRADIEAKIRSLDRQDPMVTRLDSGRVVTTKRIAFTMPVSAYSKSQTPRNLPELARKSRRCRSEFDLISETDSSQFRHED